MEDRGWKIEDRGSRIEDRRWLLHLYPPSSILYPPSSILHPPSSILYPPSSILCPRSSILYPLSSILDCRPPEVIVYERPHHLRGTLQDVLLHLTREERIPTDEITVLSPLREKSRLWDSRMTQGPQLTDRWLAPPGHVYFTTIHSFKGLERAVIILAEIDHWAGQADSLNHLLYVGCSRARNHLIVLLCEEADPEVRAAFTVAGG